MTGARRDGGHGRALPPPEPGVLAVAPAPTDDEAAALLAVLLQPFAATEPPAVADASAWALAGRRRARLGLAAGAPVGWGRPLREGRR